MPQADSASVFPAWYVATPVTFYAALLLGLICFAAFLAGRERAINAAQGQRGDLHSLPDYHGYYVAILTAAPALALLIAYSVFGTAIAEAFLRAGLPADILALPEERLQVFLNDVRATAFGGIGSDASRAGLAEAAGSLRTIDSTLKSVVAVAALLIGVGGLFAARARITAEFRARNAVEGVIRLSLVACATIAILTTIGIVASLLFESARFIDMARPAPQGVFSQVVDALEVSAEEAEERGLNEAEAAALTPDADTMAELRRFARSARDVVAARALEENEAGETPERSEVWRVAEEQLVDMRAIAGPEWDDEIDRVASAWRGRCCSPTSYFFALRDFLFGMQWSPQTAIRADQIGQSGAFGAVPLFYGTMMITIIAMLVAGPIGLFSAIYLSEYASPRARAVIKPALEILAGIPTVVYGFFALLTVAPAIRAAATALGLDAPSQSALAAGVVMGIMIIPFVSSLSDDVINAVPQSLRDGSLAMGATTSETITKVVMPAALPGVMGALLLAISRAVGETMIVVMAAGQAARITANPLESVTTITVQIVSLLTGDTEFDSAKTLSAFALGLVLFLLTLLMNVVALQIVRKYRERYE